MTSLGDCMLNTAWWPMQSVPLELSFRDFGGRDLFQVVLFRKEF